MLFFSNSSQSYLQEFRWRSFYWLIGFLWALVAAYGKREVFIFLLTEPLLQVVPSEKAGALIYLKITEAFFAQIYLSLLVAALASSSLFWIQCWFFLAPALYWQEQRLFLRLLWASYSFLLGALFFTKDLLLPQAWSFFLSFSWLPSLGEESRETFSYFPSLIPYLNLSLEVYSGLLLTSQLPIILFLMVHWNWMGESFLVKSRPWVILILLIWGGLISPPDLLSQLLIFFPLFLIYEGMIWILFCWRALPAAFHYKKSSNEAKENSP